MGLSVAMTDKLLDHLDRYSIGDDGLLFPLSRLADELVKEAVPHKVRAIPDDLGRTPAARVGAPTDTAR